MYPRRLNLQCTLNTRELGGYFGDDYTITKYKQFLRSDDVSHCNEEDIQTLKAYGVKTVIDLRGDSEIERCPNVFAGCEGIQYYNIPLIPEEQLNTEQGSLSLQMDQVYIGIIENHEVVYDLFQTILANREGIILYHCTAGKDRTGVTTLLLYMLAGVSLSDIMADYQVTFTYIQPLIDKWKLAYPHNPRHGFKSKPEWIETAYHFVNRTYGNVRAYFIHIGFDEEMIDALKKMICVNVMGTAVELTACGAKDTIILDGSVI